MELLVTAGLLSILTLGVLSLFGTAMDQWSRGSGKSEADDVASIVSQQVVRYIQDGKSATSTIGGLSVRLPGTNDQGDYERALNGDLILFYTASGKLYRRVNSNTATQIATGVQTFSYSVVGGNVTFTLTINRTSGTRTSTSSFTQRVALRNYTTAS
jgi:hypothetical protein